MPESYTSYISRIEEANYLECQAHRKKFGVSEEMMDTHDCDILPCYSTCPFIPRTKEVVPAVI